ncbi:MAG: RtcB family protein [Ferruginibacter sp.]
MKKLSLKAKEIRAIGYPQTPVIPIAMQIMGKEFKFETKEKAVEILAAILANPEAYLEHAQLAPIATQLSAQKVKDADRIDLNSSGIHFEVFGKEGIMENALHQMYMAAKLPIAVAGALMPDAHSGYGLPIGGVLATQNAVIPYGVGVDIGCRMCLSVFAIPANQLMQQHQKWERLLTENTLFGSGGMFDKPANHPVLEENLFQQLPLLKPLHGRVWKQLGTSGSGNHFAEFGIVQIAEKDAVLGVEPGEYVGLLTHSGSRALGANIAAYYTKIAKEKRKLPGEAANLAWLNLDEEAGIEYWLAMNLAGDYAAACHHVIHKKIAKQLGEKPIRMVENHHNFAWKEMYNNQEVIVHRKGATPAGKDVLGIIPGSMTAPGFIVKGKGVEAAVHSASHGAGRAMSRTQAQASFTASAMKAELKKHGVTLIGGGLDEAPFAYKDIHAVMQGQQDLVDTIGMFIPKIVQMDGAAPKQYGKKAKCILGE